MMTRYTFVFFVSLFFSVAPLGPPGATASNGIASAAYVQESVSKKVDTSASANQTMQGNYTVSGTLTVPTPPLPPKE